jgi:hypothetical protein
MTRGLLLPAFALVMLAAPAFAQGQCSAPIAPIIPDGKTATAPQLSQAAKNAVAFIRTSDTYQVCILTDIAAQDQQAKDNKKTLDPAIRKSLEDKGEANQKEKERIGKQYNMAAAAYKAVHPK